VVKAVAKLTLKVTIYPSKEELRGTAEAYLSANHSEFFDKFTESRWTAFYNANFHKRVSSFLFKFLNRKIINFSLLFYSY
jgi:hypothetical protein